MTFLKVVFRNFEEGNEETRHNERISNAEPCPKIFKVKSLSNYILIVPKSHEPGLKRLSVRVLSAA